MRDLNFNFSSRLTSRCCGHKRRGCCLSWHFNDLDGFFLRRSRTSSQWLKQQKQTPLPFLELQKIWCFDWENKKSSYNIQTSPMLALSGSSSSIFALIEVLKSLCWCNPKKTTLPTSCFSFSLGGPSCDVKNLWFTGKNTNQQTNTSFLSFFFFAFQ